MSTQSYEEALDHWKSSFRSEQEYVSEEVCCGHIDYAESADLLNRWIRDNPSPKKADFDTKSKSVV